MRETSDVIIVGAGVIGMMTARELRAAGLSVSVIDRGLAGAESSHAGGGLLSPLYPWEAPAPVAALARWSLPRWERICRRLHDATGIDPEYEPCGVMLLEPVDATAAAAWAQAEGAPIEFLQGDDVAACEPGLAEHWRTATFLPGIAQLRNPRLMRALTAAAIADGVTLIEHAAVEDITLEAGDGGARRVTGVRAGGRDFAAGSVVVAAGAWSDRVLAGLASFAIRPMRGQMLWYQAAPGTLRRVVLNGEGYLIPRRDGVILAGSTVEDAGFDKSMTEEAIAHLRREAGRICPALREVAPAGSWAGLRPGSPDGVPAIGPVPGVDGLHVNAGHFRNGLNLAPASARLCADLMLEREPALDPAPYDPAILAG